MAYSKRKNPRLKDYDYSKEGAYFITICTEGRNKCLSNIIVFNEGVGRGDSDTPQEDIQLLLTDTGEITEKYIQQIPKHYPDVLVDKYVIMPDHIHILLVLDDHKRRAESSRPTRISQVIGVLKRMIHREIGHKVFQDSYYDHIIRDEQDYVTRWNYMAENPSKWLEKREENC